MSFANFSSCTAGNSKWKPPAHPIAPRGWTSIPAIQHGLCLRDNTPMLPHRRANAGRPNKQADRVRGSESHPSFARSMTSPNSAFWWAASSLRNTAALERAHRRALTALIVLALRQDRIGSQATAVLNGVRKRSSKRSEPASVGLLLQYRKSCSFDI
jgi:hypothetical protein